ncbi:MAG: heat-inducible transcriptional repressor HrcA [Vicinamibacterales bacterium]
MSSYELSERSRQLLATLVRAYIETGEPVSSQVLARESGLGVSSATVRNVLVHLEEAGYVHQPHTSAGRVPTDRAYRVFVDLLLEGRKPTRPSAEVEHRLRQHAAAAPLMDQLLAGVSHLVARTSGQVGFAMAENHAAVLRRIEVIPLAGTQVLVVVVSDGNQVMQKAVDTEEPVRPQDLVQAANYLNSEFAGLPLIQVREAVLARIQQERTLYDELFARAMQLARSTLEDLPTQQTFYMEGVASLLGEALHDAATLPTLRALVEMMEEKERMVRLLTRYIDGPGLTVVIGAEHETPDLRAFSLVASTAVDGPTIRTVGLIGPTRMHYSRAIALVDGTTQAVSRVLKRPN